MSDRVRPADAFAPARPRASRTDPTVRRDQIIDAAAALLQEHSFADITMRMLQEHLGLSKGGVYHYVGSKDDILLLACEQAGRSMLDALADAQRVPGSARDKLDRLVDGHVRVVQKYGGALWAFFTVREKLPSDKQETILSLEREYLRGIVSLLREGQTSGEVCTDVDARLLADALLGMINWFVRWRGANQADDGALPATFARIFADATFVTPDDRPGS